MVSLELNLPMPDPEKECCECGCRLTKHNIFFSMFVDICQECAASMSEQKKRNQSKMIIAYICHPIAGDVSENLMRIREIVRKINLTELDVVPFVPYYSDARAMDDNVIPERRRAIKNTEEIFRRGIIDEVRLYGPRISAGMDNEIRLALQLGIKVVNKSSDFEYDETKFVSWNIRQK